MRVDVVRLALGGSVAFVVVRGQGLLTLFLNTDRTDPEKRGGGLPEAARQVMSAEDD